MLSVFLAPIRHPSGLLEALTIIIFHEAVIIGVPFLLMSKLRDPLAQALAFGLGVATILHRLAVWNSSQSDSFTLFVVAMASAAWYLQWHLRKVQIANDSSAGSSPSV